MPLPEYYSPAQAPPNLPQTDVFVDYFFCPSCGFRILLSPFPFLVHESLNPLKSPFGRPYTMPYRMYLVVFASRMRSTHLCSVSAHVWCFRDQCVIPCSVHVVDGRMDITSYVPLSVPQPHSSITHKKSPPEHSNLPLNRA